MTWRIEHVEQTGSTNDDLIAAAIAGAPDRSVLITGHQTAGRGRMDRRWDAPPGSNLLMSVLFRQVPDVPAELTHRIGVAILDGAQSAVRVAGGRSAEASPPASSTSPSPSPPSSPPSSPLSSPLSSPQPPSASVSASASSSPSGSASASDSRALSLKWPNDALLHGRKLAGVLAQMALMPNGDPFVVVGFGVNVGWCPPDAARLGELASELKPRLLADEVLAAFDRLPVEPTVFHERYRSELATLGQRVRVQLPGDAADVIGVAVDVDLTGRLVVEPDVQPGSRASAESGRSLQQESTRRRAFDTADIVHLRPAD